MLTDLNVIGISNYLVTVSEFSVYAWEKWESLAIQEKGYFPPTSMVRLHMSKPLPQPAWLERTRDLSRGDGEIKKKKDTETLYK